MTSDLAAAVLVLAELLAACMAPPPVETGSISFMDLTNPGLTVSAPIFVKIDTDNPHHLDACGDLVVRDVPPPDPPPPPTLRESLEQGGTHGIRLVPLVYTWREFDPFDARYDTSVVWRDGENNYWCPRHLAGWLADTGLGVE